MLKNISTKFVNNLQRLIKKEKEISKSKLNSSLNLTNYLSNNQS